MPSHKPANAREKDLRLALYRIERGRAHSGATKISIAAVAREAGVSAALIHNHYPMIGEAIRERQGHASRVQREAKHEQLIRERQKNRALRHEVAALQGKIRKLASINEVLAGEVQRFRAIKNRSDVFDATRLSSTGNKKL